MWELDYKESWALKYWCFWTVVLETTFENPLDCKEIQPVHPKGISPEYSLEGLMLEAETPILWPPDAKSWLTGKDLDAWKDWRQEEKGMAEDEMVGWRHWLDWHEFEQAPGAGDGQGRLRAAVHGVVKNWTRLSDWNELKWTEAEGGEPNNKPLNSGSPLRRRTVASLMGADHCRVRSGDCLCSRPGSVGRRRGVISTIFRTCTCARSMDHSHAASQSVVLPSGAEPERSVASFKWQVSANPTIPWASCVFVCGPVLLGTNTQRNL